MIEAQNSFQELDRKLSAARNRLNQDCLSLAQDYEGKVRQSLCLETDSIAKVPFGQVLLPFLLDAVRVIDKNPLYAGLKSKPRASLELNLLERLSAQSIYCLYFEFTQAGPDLTGLLPPEAKLLSENSLYLEFVKKMHRGQLSIFISQYPELERCFLKIAENWISNLEELLSRLQADKELLSKEFLAGNQPLQLENLTLSLSDPHNNGRTVALLEFANGQAVYYKPRDCSSDFNYAVLVDWFCRRGARLAAARTLNRGAYGWSEPVLKRECRNTGELNAFYKASGALLCFLYALKAVDSHFENVIAAGDLPVLIDCETLIYPDKDELMSWLALPPDFERDSVFSSNLISPKYAEDSPLKRLPDTSALGCGAGADSFELPMPVLLNCNLDSMYLEKRPSFEQLLKHYLPKMNSQVIFKGQIQNFRDFKAEILSGFNEMYELFLKHQDELLESKSPLFAFQKQYVRAMFRPARVYTCLLQMASKPDLMKDTAGRRRYLEHTLISMIKDCPDYLLPMIEIELASLADDLDVPYFAFRADHANAFSWTRLRSSCFEGVLSRIASFSRQGLEKHLAALAETFT